MTDDYKTAVSFKNQYPDKFKIVRYEDIVAQPIKIVRDMFTFFDMEFAREVVRYLLFNTKPSEVGLYTYGY